jgi:hypothetical protein
MAGFFDKLINSVRGIGAPKLDPQTIPDGGGPVRDLLDNNALEPMLQWMHGMPKPDVTQRESKNVRDYRGYFGQGLIDQYQDKLQGLPMSERHFTYRGVPSAAWKYLPTPEDISGGLPRHWPKR